MSRLRVPSPCVADLYVKEACRGKGVGMALIKAVAGVAKVGGFIYICLGESYNVYSSNYSIRTLVFIRARRIPMHKGTYTANVHASGCFPGHSEVVGDGHLAVVADIPLAHLLTPFSSDFPFPLHTYTLEPI